MAKHETPLLDQLESGPWPSFVSDLKQQAEVRAKNEANVEFQIPQDVVEDLLGCWSFPTSMAAPTGSTAASSVFSVTAAVLSAAIATSRNSFRVWRTSTPCASTSPAENSIRPNICASSVICGIFAAAASPTCTDPPATSFFSEPPRPQLEEIFYEMTHNLNQDLGGSGSNLRTPSDCIGAARCEYACYDTHALCYHLTQEYQDELHRPAFPYKFKFKFDGCPNCCVASIARADMSYIGTWSDDIRIDQEAVQAYIGGELPPNAGAHSGRDWGPFDIQKEVIDLCPTKCMWMEDNKLMIDNKECNRCMHCINVMPRALRIGEDRGLSILVGAKAPILDGAQMGSMLVPFVKAEEPYDEIKEIIEGIWDWWMEEGKNRERLGELMKRQGFQKLLEATGLKPDPRMVSEPRSNPYIFWKEEEVEGGWTRDINEFRKYHQR